MEIGLPADPTEVQELWSEHLRSVSATKESISKTAKFAIENSYAATELFDSLLKRTSQVCNSLPLHLPLFSLFIFSIFLDLKPKRVQINKTCSHTFPV